MPRLLFGPYAPDQPSFQAQFLTEATNTYAAALGYRPVKAFVPLLPALNSRPKGASSFVSPGGDTSIICGDRSSLYAASATGWSKISSGYTLSNKDRWRFAQFGGLAIATNGHDPMVKIDLTDRSYPVGGLGGSPPRFKSLMVVKDFLVGLVLDGDVSTLGWAGINNAESWTFGENQSDFQIMPSGGAITGGFGGEEGIILQRGRISRMSYVGDNFVFTFNEISYNLGCVTMHSVAQAGQLGFFLSDTGFIMWTGAELKPIGQERVDRTFASLYGPNDWDLMSTAVDVKNNLVSWAMPDRMFIYNWVLDRWSVIEQPSTIIFSGYSRAVSIDEIDALYGNIDSPMPSLDSEEFKGGDPRFYVFNDLFEMGTFSGPAMAASFTLGDQEITPGREARINAVRPLTDATAGLTARFLSRKRLGDVVTENAYSSLRDNGELPVREVGRYSRAGLDIAASTDWTFAQGMDCTAAAGGRR
jgi:hypothetical protein